MPDAHPGRLIISVIMFVISGDRCFSLTTFHGTMLFQEVEDVVLVLVDILKSIASNCKALSVSSPQIVTLVGPELVSSVSNSKYALIIVSPGARRILVNLIPTI